MHEVPQGKYKNAMASFQKEKELPESKGNPLALTLGTTILLTLCNFLIAQHKSIIIKIRIVAHVFLISMIYSMLPVCAQKNGYDALEPCYGLFLLQTRRF